MSRRTERKHHPGVTHAKVVEVVGPILELLVGAARHAEVGGDVLHGGVGRHADAEQN